MNTLLITTLGLILSACGKMSPLYFEVKDLEPISGEPDFATVRSLILKPKCVGCHVNYDTYSSVKADLMKISDEVNADRMPKNSPPLSPDQKEFLRRWVSAGAPEGSSGTPDDPDLVNWKKVSTEILGPKCILCHNPNGQAKFLDLSSRSAIWSEREKLLNFETPEESYLMSVISDPVEPMPPVWSGLPPVTDEEKELLKKWIGSGIP